jgi:hypothetical protein
MSSGEGSALAKSASKKIEVKEATELAEFYHVPQIMVNLFFIDFNGKMYPLEAFLLHQGHKKGIRAIQVTKPILDPKSGEWECEATIYPEINLQHLNELFKQLPNPEARMEVFRYMSLPTKEWGKASSKNVAMTTMQQWLPQIAIKRAVCRALRLFAGIGTTAYVELPEAQLSPQELEEGKDYKIIDTEKEKASQGPPSEPPNSGQATLAAPAGPVAPQTAQTP